MKANILVYDVLIRAQQHDALALEILIEKYQPLLYTVACKYGRYNEDCYQEMVMVMIQAIYKFDLHKIMD